MVSCGSESEYTQMKPFWQQFHMVLAFDHYREQKGQLLCVNILNKSGKL